MYAFEKNLGFVPIFDVTFYGNCHEVEVLFVGLPSCKSSPQILSSSVLWNLDSSVVFYV